MRRLAPALCLLGGALLLAGAAPEPALPGATEASRAEARKLLVANHTDTLMAATFAAMRDALVGQIVTVSGKPRETIAVIVDEVLMPAMQARVGELTDAIAEIYASDYDVTELRQLESFYATPVGQKMLRLTPLLAQQVNGASQAWAKQVVPDAIRAHAQELRERGLKL